MFIGKVIGTVTSTVKEPSLTGVKLLVVRLQDDSGKVIVAADASHVAGRGDDVYILKSKEGALALDIGRTPVDAGIAGIVDEIKIKNSNL